MLGLFLMFFSFNIYFIFWFAFKFVTCWSAWVLFACSNPVGIAWCHVYGYDSVTVVIEQSLINLRPLTFSLFVVSFDLSSDVRLDTLESRRISSVEPRRATDPLEFFHKPT